MVKRQSNHTQLLAACRLGHQLAELALLLLLLLLLSVLSSHSLRQLSWQKNW